MALTPEQQIGEAIKKSNYILIALRKNFEADSLASALALSLFFKKLNKAFDIVCEDIALPEHLKFLPGSEKVSGRMEELQKLIISIDLKDNEIDQFSYDIKDRTLNIYVTPKFSSFEKDHIHTEFSPYKYDLVCVVDTPDLEMLGKLYETHTEFFSHTPVINIDHHPSNENFGQINYVNLNASSACEIIFDILSQVGIEHFDQNIATCILAGIISKTKSFTSKNATPKTLQAAKNLIEIGADRTLIIKNLFRNKSVATLNLWGRILARLKTEERLGLSWSLVTENDFLETLTTEKNFEGIVDEFIKDIPEIEIFAILFQKGQGVHAIITSVHTQTDIFSLLSTLKPHGTKYLAGLTLADTALVDAEKQIIGELKNKLEAQKLQR